MRWTTESWKWIRSIGRRRALESGLDEEIRFHIDQQTAKNRRAEKDAKLAPCHQSARLILLSILLKLILIAHIRSSPTL